MGRRIEDLGVRKYIEGYVRYMYNIYDMTFFFFFLKTFSFHFFSLLLRKFCDFLVLSYPHNLTVTSGALKSRESFR